MKLFPKLVLGVILSSVITPQVWAQRDAKEAVVKIYSVYNKLNYDSPWQIVAQGSRNGSGCIISGRRILTNAHIVGDQTFIQVRRAGEAKRYTAEVEMVTHECDLAVLRVTDDSFFSGIKPIEMGDLTELGDEVAVYGFPWGGDKLCITEGVVSRVEHTVYRHSIAHLLACQIDAAINPGSSGGPVIKGNKIVGVAFQAGYGENMGYMVPAPVINHFLEDIKDGKYDGIPGLGISWQRMENPDLRGKFGMTEEQTGVLVNKIYLDSPASGILQAGDIIFSIDGKSIGNDATIEFRKGERTFFGYPIQRKHINDTVNLTVLRENNIVNAELKLSKPINFERLVPYEQYDVSPTYYILGGLVFEPLTVNYLKMWGSKWHNNAPSDLLNYYDNGEQTDERKEVVVLVKVLADEINAGYHDLKSRVISHVNGNKISTMQDLVSAFVEHKGRYHVIEDERGYKIVLDKNKVDKNGKRILKKYKINSDRSKNLEHW